MNLKERLDTYAPQPDPQVWQSVSSSLRRQVVRRRAVMASVAALAVAGTAVALLLSRGPQSSAISESPVVIPATQVAMNTEPQSSSVASEVPTTSTQQPQAKAETTAAVTPSVTVPVVESTPAPAVESKSAPATKAPAIKAPVVTEPKASVSKAPEADQASSIKAPAAVQQSQAPVVKSQPAPQSKATTTPSEKTPSKVIPVTVEDELAFWQPNAFTPGDNFGANPTWYLPLKDGRHVKSFKIYIYSRSGRQVYKSNDYNQRWDGTCNGQPMPAGAYTYIFEYYDIDLGKLANGRGTITLIR